MRERPHANLPPPNFSVYGERARHPSPVNEMMAEFASGFRDGVDINLGVGYVNESTMPREAIARALEEIIARPRAHRQAFNYGGPRGAPALHEALRRFFARRRLGGLDDAALARNRFLIGGNGATSILEAFAAVLRPGIVITADPMYYIYCDVLARYGYEVVTVPEGRDGLEPDRVAERIASLGARQRDISFLYAVTVNNPSGSVLSNANRLGLARLAAQLSRDLERPVPLVLDQAYEWLLHDCTAETPQSALLDDPLGVVYEVGTLSKVLAPALRIGFALGAPGPLMEALTQRTSDMGFSASLLAQEIAAWLLEHEVDAQLARVNAGYREKAQRTAEAIDGRLGPWIASCSGGQAGFYYYLTFREIETDPESAFFRFLTRTTGDPEIDGPSDNRRPRVIYIPGSYCVHPAGEMAAMGRRQLRISYGFEESGAIASALALMSEAAAYAASAPALRSSAPSE